MRLTKLQEIDRFIKGVKQRGNKVLLITDENISSFYLEFIKTLGFSYFILPATERMKSREGKILIEDYLFENGFYRNTELIAFGGGVISDLTGFVAATYMRGVAFSIIPTTVTCLVDASIGGKNGINTKHGKNLLGTFYAPVDVCLEEVFLKTLDKKMYEEQFSEVIKISLTSDRELFFSMKDPIQRARKLKEQIVELDQKDIGIRQVLNFGHTFAHAYENLSDYTICHGKAVLIGLYFASLLSVNLNILPQSEWEMIKKFLDGYQSLPFHPDFDKKTMYEAMRSDKKNKNGKPCFIILSKIGSIHTKNGQVCHEVEEKIIMKTFDQMLRRKSAVCSKT